MSVLESGAKVDDGGLVVYVVLSAAGKKGKSQFTISLLIPTTQEEKAARKVCPLLKSVLNFVELRDIHTYINFI